MIFRNGTKEMMSYSGDYACSNSVSGNDDNRFYFKNRHNLSWKQSIVKSTISSVSGEGAQGASISGGWTTKQEKLSIVFDRDLNSILEE